MQIETTDLDLRIWEEELASFVPQEVFDVHLHLSAPEHDLSGTRCQQIGRPGEWTDDDLLSFDRADAEDVYATLLPNRTVHCAGIPWPFPVIDFDGANAFVAAEMAADPAAAAVMLVHPSFSAQKVAEAVEVHGFRGLKPYSAYAENSVECRVTDMLPEHLMEVADEKELFVVLHVSKKLGIADEQNIRDLTDLTRRYPKVRWDLAHMARSSIAWPLERTIDRLKELPNIWFDFSSVTNADVFLLAFRNFAIDRIMFGSDMPSDLRRGNMVGFGLGWAFLTAPEIVAMGIDYCDNRCTFLLYETLRALRRAAMIEGLGARQIEDLFNHNATAFVRGQPRRGEGTGTGP